MSTTYHKKIAFNKIRARLSEVAAPKSEDEQRFIDKHKIEFWDHPVALRHQFTGEIPKDTSRDADYQPGEDEEVYEDVNEAIKGWKHAASDIAKARSDMKTSQMSVKLVSLKKDGGESKMHDATKRFNSEDEAHRHHENITKLNPKSRIRHNMYVNNQHVKTLGESWDEEVYESHDLGPWKTDMKMLSAREFYDRHHITKGDAREHMKIVAGKVNNSKHGNYLSTLKRESWDEEVYEDVNLSEEVFSAGAMKFGDGKTVIIKVEEANILNKLHNSLKTDSKTEMLKHAQKSKKNFDSVVKFATETLG